ncbi:MFS general substrate transporter [Backusella circina FSU 941]|nr:MFS general substrate transporter [Backusella circina FSU 941]
MDSKEPTIQEKDLEGLSDTKCTIAERALVLKMDFFYVMPFVLVVSFLQFLDKLTINYSSVMGLLSDTSITNDQFGFVGSVYSIGSLVAQIPTAFLIHKFSATKCLGVLVICWGTVVALTAIAKSYSHLVALRFALGFFEAGSNPCCILIVNRMYRRSEQARRINFVSLGNAVALTFGGLVSYGIGHMKNIRGIHSWQWLMILLGVFTILWGILILFLMVGDPKSKLLSLTPEQEQIVDHRILDNAVVVSQKINYQHIKESLLEPRYYCLVFGAILVSLQIGSLQTFSSIIISNFGYKDLDAILLGIPSGVFKILFSIVGAWYVGRYGNLLYSLIFTTGVTTLGLLLMIVIPLFKAKLVGLYLAMVSGFIITFIQSCVANNVAGYTKKVFYVSSVVASVTLGNFIGPLLMIDAQKPLYLGAIITYIGSNIISIILFSYCRYSMSKINKERFNNPVDKVNEKDPTDKENPNFIYKL